MGLHVAAEMQRAGEQVTQDAAALLSSADDERLHRLLPRLPFVGDAPWSVVLTGPFNAGKSSIAFALTGDPSIVIDADVATNHTERYPWRSIEVVDTPGVRTGDHLHDEIAETAMRVADLVLFVITPNLFDDTIAAYFRHVAVELGKLQQMIVIVNKATILAAAPEVRERAVREVLGPDLNPPLIVACDARAALEADSAIDPETRELASRRANWTGFEAALEDFVRAQATTGRLHKPFDAVLAVAHDAAELLLPSETELAARDLLDRQRQIMAQSRERLSGRFEDVYDRLKQSVTNAGEKVVASARDGIPQVAAVAEFDKTVHVLAKGLGDKLQVALSEEMVALDADGHRVAEGPEAIRLTAALNTAVDPLITRNRAGTPGPALHDLLKSFAQGQGKDWLRGFAKGGARPGSPMHSLVTELGGKFGKQFKPWEAVKWSKRLNVALEAATALFEFVSAVNQAVKDDQRQAAAIADLRANVHEVSEGLISTARVDIAPLIADLYASMLTPIDEAEAELDSAQRERARIATGLSDLSHRAREALSGPVNGRLGDKDA